MLFKNDFFCTVTIVFFIFSEFVLDDRDIFPYNCEKKEQFILKGLGKFLWLSLLIYYSSVPLTMYGTVVNTVHLEDHVIPSCSK